MSEWGGDREKSADTHTYTEKKNKKACTQNAREERGKSESRATQRPPISRTPVSQASLPARIYMSSAIHLTRTPARTLRTDAHGYWLRYPQVVEPQGWPANKNKYTFFVLFCCGGNWSHVSSLFCQGRLCVLCFRFKCSCMFFSLGLELTFIDLYSILVLFHICIFPFFVCVLYLRYI